MTKPCDPPDYVIDSRSPLFSSSDFLSLLSPHTPQILFPDLVYSTKEIKKIIPILNINPCPFSEELGHSYGYKFEPTFTNSIYAILYRVLAVPSVPIPQEICASKGWVTQVQKLQYVPTTAELDYISNLKPHQRVRITKAYGQLKYCVNAPATLEAFPKCDELLFKGKPRIIWNVPPFFQALLGPVVRALTFHMKETFDGNRIYFSEKNKRFTLKFACGVVAEDLDYWFNHALSMLKNNLIDWAGIFLGDDTAVLYQENGCIFARESDFSAFDSTQRSAVQKRILSHYEVLGVPEPLLGYFWAMASSKLVVRYGPDRNYKFKIAISEPQTATGKPDTCVANSLINMDSTIHVMDGGSYADFGFDAKIKVHTRIADVTFLKGFWCLDISGSYVWNYLPSLSLKLLKTFELGKATLKQKLCENLSSIGPCSSPLISTLIKRFIPEFKVAPTIYKVFANTWRELVPRKINKFMTRRYGRDGMMMIQSLDSLLESVELGSELFHPAWMRLALVDYGEGLPKDSQ